MKMKVNGRKLTSLTASAQKFVGAIALFAVVSCLNKQQVARQIIQRVAHQIIQRVDRQIIQRVAHQITPAGSSPG